MVVILAITTADGTGKFIVADSIEHAFGLAYRESARSTCHIVIWMRAYGSCEVTTIKASDHYGWEPAPIKE